MFTLHTPSLGFINKNVIHLDYRREGTVVSSTNGDSLIVELYNGNWQLYNYNDHGFLQNNGPAHEVVIDNSGNVVFVQDSAISIFDGVTTIYMTSLNSDFLDDQITDAIFDTSGLMHVAYENIITSRRRC